MTISVIAGHSYYVNDVAWSRIVFGSCIPVDYYDQPSIGTQVRMNSNNEDHTINGSNSVLISCIQLQGISISGPVSE